MSDLTKFEQMLRLYPTSCDRLGDWSRDMPWRVEGGYFVTTYSRCAIDGKQQTAQVRIRREMFLHKFVEVDIAATLRHADMVERDPITYGRPSWKRGARR